MICDGDLATRTHRVPPITYVLYKQTSEIMKQTGERNAGGFDAVRMLSGVSKKFNMADGKLIF